VTLAHEYEFGSFWHGPLNPFVYACLSSFPQAEVSLRLFSYDQHVELPPGVHGADARIGIYPNRDATSPLTIAVERGTVRAQA